MAQYCYKTHSQDPQNFPKIDAVTTFPIVTWECEIHPTNITKLSGNALRKSAGCDALTLTVVSSHDSPPCILLQQTFYVPRSVVVMIVGI